MSRHLFGTDGVRGRANSEPMTAEIAMRIGMAAGQVFNRGDHRHRVVIGKDTRLSGYMIEQALTAGFLSVGMDVLLLGPLPTPAVGFLTRSMRADLGVMISASHNPFEDNGIKLFGPDGFKLSDAVEADIEALVADASPAPRGARAIGRAKRHRRRDGRYIEAVKASVRRRLDLDGPQDRRRLRQWRRLQGRADGAVGARRRGDPDGGDARRLQHQRQVRLDPSRGVAGSVVMHGADIGIALDGDADRVMLVCEHGRVIDGDQLMATIANRWAKDGTLVGGGLVATVMSNLGLERYLGDRKLSLVRAAVGDRYVLERMRADGYNLGGEQSGHIIVIDHATTGDGLMAALQALSAMIKSRKPGQRGLPCLRAGAAAPEERARGSTPTPPLPPLR